MSRLVCGIIKYTTVTTRVARCTRRYVVVVITSTHKFGEGLLKRTLEAVSAKSAGALRNAWTIATEL